MIADSTFLDMGRGHAVASVIIYKSREERTRVPAHVYRRGRIRLPDLLDLVKYVSCDEGLVFTRIAFPLVVDLTQIHPVAQQMRQRPCGKSKPRPPNAR
jgi:hypothetical protein